jgi:hypothetical protein
MDSSKFMFDKYEKYIDMVSFWIAVTNNKLVSPHVTFISVMFFGGRDKQSSYLFVSTFHSLTWSFEAANKRSALSS